MSARIGFGTVVCGVLLAGCQPDLGAAREPIALDEPFYRCKVQPILVKSCGALLCHGDATRFYRIFGRNRLRYGLPEEKRGDPLMDEETAFNYQSALAYVDAEEPEKSLLLLKPLDQAAGGYYHGGALEFDQGDVYLSKEEPEFQVLIEWVNGAKEDELCVEPGL